MMGSFEKKLQEYNDYLEKLKSNAIYINYKYLLTCNDEKSQAKCRALENSPVVQKYLRISKYVHAIDNLFDNSFFDRYLKFIQMNFNKKTLKAAKDCFEDGIPMKLWYDALVYNLQSGAVGSFYAQKIEHLQRLINESDLAKKISDCVEMLQEASDLSEENLAVFLGISGYSLNAMKNKADNVSPGLWEKTILLLEKKLTDNLKKDVAVFIGELIFLLKEKKYDFIDTQKVKINLNQINSKFDSLIEIFSKGNLSESFNCFINGYRFSSWWKNFWMVNVDQIDEPEKVSEIIEKYNKLIEVLYVKKIEQSKLDGEDIYGYLLSKFLLSIGMTKKEFAEYTGIPVLLVDKILVNSFYPDSNMKKKILLFLNGWICENNFQKQFLLEVKDAFLGLVKVNEMTYHFYSISDLDKYEKIMKVDDFLKNYIKDCDYDWYLKCVICNYILNVLGNPTSEDYFYDGLLVDKWLTYQKATVSKLKDQSILCEKKALMFECLQKKKNNFGVEVKKDKTGVLKEQLLISHFEDYVNALTQYIYKMGKLPVGETVDDFLLIDVWKICNRLIKVENSLNLSQVELIRAMKYSYVFVKKGRIQYDGLVNFAFYLSLFLENIDLSLDDLSLSTGIPVSNLIRYADGNTLPTNDELSVFLKMLENLKARYANNYILKSIEDFKKVIMYMTHIDYYTNTMTVLNSFENNKNFEDDINQTVLKAVNARDPEWYKKFARMANILNNNLLLNVAFVSKTNNDFIWFLNMVQIAHNNLCIEQKILLDYLIVINKRNMVYSSYLKFNNMFGLIKKYILEKKEKPPYGIVELSDSYLREYFDDLEQYYYGKNNNFWFLSNKDLVQIKELLHFLSLNDERFVMQGDDLKLRLVGQHVNYLKISLGLTTIDFATIVGMDVSRLVGILSNNCAICQDDVEKILDYLLVIIKGSLRRDQLDDLNNFTAFIKKLDVSCCSKLILENK